MAAPHVHPIEARSYEIMFDLVDFSAWGPGERDVVARMVHATADETFAETALVGGEFIETSLEALRAGEPVICDARMVVAGVAGARLVGKVECFLEAGTPAPGALLSDLAPPDTRSAAAMDRAAARHPAGGLWVFGNAPTALARLLALCAAGAARPSAVIGLPVGYVGAAEAKSDLWASPLAPRSLTNRGRRGGSAVAAASVNALARLAGT